MGIFIDFKFVYGYNLYEDVKVMNEQFTLAFVLYKDKNIMIPEIARFYKKLWNEDLKMDIGVDQIRGTIQQFSYVISFVDEPIDRSEMNNVANHNPFFKEGVEIANRHVCHAVVGVKGVGSTVARYKVLTQLLAAMMSPYNAVAVYLGKQSLYYGKDHLLNQAKLISKGILPVQAWIYFGFYTFDNKFWVYTQGLDEFGREEVEIASDSHTMAYMHHIAIAFSSALMSSHRQFEDDEMIEIDEDFVTCRHRFSPTLQRDTILLSIVE